MEFGYQLGNAPLVALIITIELIFGIFYAAFVDWLKRNGREHGYAAFLVVGGTFFTVAIATPLIGLLNAIIVLGAFVLTGLPMILVVTYRHTEDRAKDLAKTRNLMAEYLAAASVNDEVLAALQQLLQQQNQVENDGH